MTSDALKTLFHPFEAGLIEPPASGTPALFLNARPGFRLPDGFEVELRPVQGFRPDFLALRSAGFAVAPEAQDDGYGLALVLAGRHRGENERNVAEALERVSPGGLILVAGAKEDGVASLRKRVGALAEIEDSVPKYHGIAFWFRRPAGPEAAAALRAANPDALVDGRFHTAPGMFSHGEVDAGSRLLAKNLPDDMAGNVADFCAGWGYLAAIVAERCAGVRRIDLYEAHEPSLLAAERNLQGCGEGIGLQYMWHDLVGEPVETTYDAIVMNPPFHQGRAADPALGQAMIAKAASALKRGGRLLMVANRQLPYEEALAAGFGKWREVARDGSFKVLAAAK